MREPAQVPASVPRKEALQKAKERLRERGISVTEFAKQHGLDRHTVADVLRGKRVGNHGAGHNAAVLLGLKKGVIRALSKKEET